MNKRQNNLKNIFYMALLSDFYERKNLKLTIAKSVISDFDKIRN